MIEPTSGPAGKVTTEPCTNVSPVAVSRDPAFDTWMADVRRYTRKYLGVELEALPELPYRDGFEVGDTPAEFYVGAILDAAELCDIREPN